MQDAAYTEIVFFCMAVEILIFLKMRLGMYKLLYQRTFAYVLAFASLSMGLDFLIRFVNGPNGLFGPMANSLLHSFYFAVTLFFVFSWFRYAGYVLKLPFWNDHKRLALYGLPMMVALLLVVLSLWNGCIFYVDDFNIYHRNDLYFSIYLPVCMLYTVAGMVLALVKVVQKRNYAERPIYSSAASFGALSIVVIPLHVHFNGSLPIIPAGIMLSTIYSFLLAQAHLISVDPLTQMAFHFYRFMKRSPDGNKKMKAIAHFVRVGAFAYLRRQYKTVSVVFAVLFVIFVVLAFMGIQNPFVPVAFLTGGFFSGLCGFLGMKTATYASSRTANGAISSLNRGLVIAFRSGAVMGLVVVGFGLIDISGWFFLLNYIYDHNVWGFGADIANKVSLGAWDPSFVRNDAWNHAKMVEITTTMLTFGMGASLQALFARVGGGIYTKAADVGADLVGKVEAGIPEDDPRNPATIADNVGDNVGDVAGMGADLYESYCGSILATAALGAALGKGVTYVIAPMVVAAIGILLSLVGIYMVRTREDADTKSLLRSLLTGTLGSSVLILVALLALVKIGFISFGVFGSVFSGLVAGVLIGQFTEYYTSDAYKPTRGIAGQAKLGAATTIIDGISVGMFSTGLPVVTIVAGIIAAFGCSGGFTDMSMGLYGVGFAAVGMLSTLGITLATDAFGPIADNAGGNAEMAGLDESVRARCR